MNIRPLLVVSAILAGLSARASFDLVLVADSSASGANRIHRYDGDSGAYLGAFNVSFGSAITRIAVDGSRGVVHVARGVYVDTFNYSTGALLYSNNTGSQISDLKVNSQNGQVLLAYGATIMKSLDATSGNTTTISLSTGAATTISYSAGLNMIFAYDYNSDNYRTYSMSGAIISSRVSGFVASVPGHLVLSNGTACFLTMTNPTGAASFYASGYYSPATGIYASSSTANSLTMSNPFGLANGHGNSIWEGGTVGGTFTLRRNFFYTGATNQQFSAAQVLAPVDMDVALAPEPGSFLVLLGGTGLLLRRRKK